VRDETKQLHIISERDVGLFSLVQQVIAQIPWAVSENRVPVVHFGSNTVYWTPCGYRGKRTVWEYYFEPVIAGCPAASIPRSVRKRIAAHPPTADEVGYTVDGIAFVSSHFGDHPRLAGVTLAIPYQWDDPDDALRARAKSIIDIFVRPRAYVVRKVEDFFTRHMVGCHVIGVHARGTDAASAQEIREFRQGSLVLARYVGQIERLLEARPCATIFVASDEQSSLDYLVEAFGDRVISYDTLRHQGGEAAGKGPSGWIMPAYIAGDRDAAARNGEEAVIEYLLLSRCDVLIHNGSSLARTVLLNAPQMPHVNTHRRQTLGLRPAQIRGSQKGVNRGRS
jgi:hypothetical protein